MAKSWMRPLLVAAAAMGALHLTACSAANQPPLNVVEDFRVADYMGTWHEIATIPARFQRDCTGGATAVYAQVGEQVSVTNTCPTSDGSIKKAEARARFTGSATEGKLEVAFFNVAGWWVWPVSGRYWIIALDPAYQWSVVGEPGRDYAWILSRTQSLPPETLTQLSGVLRNAGYDTCALVVTSASQAPDRPRLCDAAR